MDQFFKTPKWKKKSIALVSIQLGKKLDNRYNGKFIIIIIFQAIVEGIWKPRSIKWGLRIKEGIACHAISQVCEAAKVCPSCGCSSFCGPQSSISKWSRTSASRHGPKKAVKHRTATIDWTLWACWILTLSMLNCSYVFFAPIL